MCIIFTAKLPLKMLKKVLKQNELDFYSPKSVIFDQSELRRRLTVITR